MAGTGPGFNGRAFRDAIRFTYNMAASPIADEQVAFYRASELVYNVPVDDDNVPFDPTSTVERITPPPVRVPCSVEYIDAEGQPVPFGSVTVSRIKCSLLDEDYAKVKDSAYVVIAGEKYTYRRTEPPTGLFDVGLYVMHFRAENEL